MPLRLPLAAALLLGLGPASSLAAEPAPLVAQGCLGCHGPQGRGAGAVPAIAGRDAAELHAQLLAFRTGGRGGTIMDRIARGYSPAELAAIAGHFAQVR
jgi:sulfide dehydrogenase cytochrome subunit